MDRRLGYFASLGIAEEHRRLAMIREIFQVGSVFAFTGVLLLLRKMVVSFDMGKRRKING